MIVSKGHVKLENWSRRINTQIIPLGIKAHVLTKIVTTGWARLNRSLSSARFYFELSGNSNYIIHCKSNYVQNFELEINLI